MPWFILMVVLLWAAGAGFLVGLTVGDHIHTGEWWWNYP